MAGPILTCDEIRASEAEAVAAGVSLSQLMEAAGRACAEALHARFPSGRVVVLAGPGNNGGDAFVAARILRQLGRSVVVHELAPGGLRTDEGAAASATWAGPRAKLSELKPASGDVILDGLFGAGLSRPLAGDAEAAVRAINASLAKVVAIDVPSGVSGDTGKDAGEAIRADLTVTFGAKKPAHVLQPAASLCGEVVVAEIGFGRHMSPIAKDRLRENGPNLWAHELRWPETEGHKYKRGRLAVVTGPVSSTGAARLAACAGLRTGAGAVTLLCPPGALEVVAASVMAPMTASFSTSAELVERTGDADAVVIGPAAGITDFTRHNVEALARAGRRLVLDADALTVFAGDASILARLLPPETVLTPHIGEFERLFPNLLANAPSKIEAARQAAAASRAVILLKGPDTVIAAPDGRAVVNTHATPFLATAGSGDVLAGIIGGLLAQGPTAFDAACAGAWMHGDAGLRAGPGLIAEDLDAALRETIRALYDAASTARRGP